MGITSNQCIGWGVLALAFIILIGSQFWNQSSSRKQQFKYFSPTVQCDYSPDVPETCLNGIGSKDSCISCSEDNRVIRLTNGELNKYLSYNSPFGTYPIQFINKHGEFINIVRYNDIKCNYDQEEMVHEEPVVPCVINNILDAYLPTSFLTEHINRALVLGILPLDAIPYKKRT